MAIEKVEATHEYILYAFGAPEDPSVGRVRLYRSSGDIELVRLSAPTEGPDARYYLAHAVPRLRTYHEQARYPDSDAWEA